MKNTESSSSTASAAPPLPPEGMRTFITLLLVVHLFAVIVAVVTNFRIFAAPDTNTYRRVQLRNVPAVVPYLQLLHMDLSYGFNYTYADQFDTDHHFEVELDWTGESHGDEAVVLRLPSYGGNGLRRSRYLNLGRSAAQRMGDGSAAQESLLPHAVARTLLKERGITTGNHRLRLQRHLLVSMENVASLDPAISDPNHTNYWMTPYEADVKFFDGELLITKQEGAGRTAPVDNTGDDAVN